MGNVTPNGASRMTGTMRMKPPPRAPTQWRDTSQRQREFTCECPKPIPEMGTYDGYHRCLICGHLIGTWGTP